MSQHELFPVLAEFFSLHLFNTCGNALSILLLMQELLKLT